MSAQRVRRATSPEQARKQRQVHLGQVIRSMRGDVTQYQLAERIAQLRQDEFQQTTISRWELGMVDLSVEQIRDVEMALGLDPGAILIAAGYVSATDDAGVAIRSDPKVHASLRGELLRVYSSFVAASKQLYGAETKRSKAAV